MHSADDCQNERMRKRQSLDGWYREQVRKDPALEKAMDALLADTVASRKLALLWDECLNESFVDWLRNERDHFKVFALPKRRSDEHLWQEARQKGRLIVTCDRDFLDDKRFPLHLSPGVLFLDAASTEDQIYAFTRFFAVGSFLDLFSRFGWDTFRNSKSSASRTHAEYRTHNPEDGSIMVWPL
jgi:predicted nuclease of predicted toxin-antitoxin system